MRTLIICLSFILVATGLHGQDKFPVLNFDRLPHHLVLNNSIERFYQVVTDYLDYDLRGNFLRKTRVTGKYTAGLENGAVRWNDVTIRYSNAENASFSSFSEGNPQEYMENFTYIPSETIVQKSFFAEIPEADMRMKNLVWDMLGLEGFAYWYWDSLRINQEFRANALNSEVDLAGEGTFENKDIRLTWIGVTDRNSEPCAIIKFSTMNNPLTIETDAITMHGRSHYWGEVYVSMQDKEIEYATLTEDVLTDITIMGQPNNMLGYTVRKMTVSRINKMSPEEKR
ncbi:MAG: hypothetical protein K9N46_01320 [Candidatus Marinimicrobia bacterium]|nr:hypothetical protein [Candidatus Neomarinimicrobiota bacterium]MCF7827884.1 hypothetical protein [Candidatus Neomarinimicrobiota bacterium]MCF7879361.1 hypothetical protein [Candidatus Neomarinimicrobiota bacterium]